MRIWLFAFFAGSVLSACSLGGLPPLDGNDLTWNDKIEIDRQLKPSIQTKPTQSPLHSLAKPLPTLNTCLQTHQTSLIQHPSSTGICERSNKELSFDWYNPGKTTLALHAQRVTFNVHYPNMQFCHLKLHHPTATLTPAQWTLFLRKLTLKNHYPNRAGQPLTPAEIKIVKENNSTHVLLGLGPEMLYIGQYSLTTQHGFSLRAIAKQAFGEKDATGLEITTVYCPGRQP